MNFKLIFNGVMSFFSSMALAGNTIIGNNNIVINGKSMSHVVDISPVKTEHRSLKQFNAVLITGAMETELRYSKDFSIEITAQKNIIENISTNVAEGVLVINQVGNIISNNKIKAVIYSPEINKIRLSGAGNIVAKEINTNSLEVDLSGAGNIKLSGNTKKLWIKRSGTGNIEAKSLISEDASLENSGVGDISIHVTKTIKLINMGVADIIIFGDPDKRQIKSIGFNDILFK